MSEARMVDLGKAIEAQSGGGFSRLILFLCCAAMVIEGYDVQVLAYAAPAIIRDWNIERAYFGPVFGAALFGYMLGATLLTSVSDQIGRKKVIVLGNIFFGLLTVASAFAPNINVLLALRFLAGLGLGCSIPSAIALAVEYAPEQHRSFRVSILFIGYTLGAALGGMLTAALIVNFGWRSTFLFGGFASLTLAVVLFFILPESARFLAVIGGRDREIAAIMQRLLPHSGIDASTCFTLAEHKPKSRDPEMMGPAPVARLVRDPRRFGLDQQLVHLEPGTSVRHPFHQTPCRLGALLVRLQSRMVVGRQKGRVSCELSGGCPFGRRARFAPSHPENAKALAGDQGPPARGHRNSQGLWSISGDEIDGPCVVRASNGASAYVTDCANKSSLILRPQPTR